MTESAEFNFKTNKDLKVKQGIRKPESCPICGKKYKTQNGKCVHCGERLDGFCW